MCLSHYSQSDQMFAVSTNAVCYAENRFLILMKHSSLDVNVFASLRVFHDKFNAWGWSDGPSVLCFVTGLSLDAAQSMNTKIADLVSKPTHPSTDWLLDNLKTI